MIRTMFYESELAPLTGHAATRDAVIDRGRDAWDVWGREHGPRHGVRRRFSRRVATLKQAQQIARAWVGYRETPR